MGHLNNTDVDVLIAGAGPTGLAMAAEAARLGLRYRIVDKAPHGAVHSQALVVQARTLEQFERYELAQQAIERGRRLHRIRIYSDGTRILETSFEELPGNYPFILFLPQPETERLLSAHVEAAGGIVEREVSLEYFVEREHGVECALLGKHGGRETVTAAYLIGADGAHSTVREVLGIPLEEVSSNLPFFLGDLRVEGDVPGDEVVVHLRGGNLVFLGRLDDTHFRVIVALSNHPNKDPEIFDFQAAIDEAAIENLRVSDPRWMALFYAGERKAPAYSRGRVFLAGDSGNIHYPIGGQGMNSGIQDAANLMWKIALVETRRAHSSILESYDRERKPLTEKAQRDTAIAMRAATASNWLLERIRDGILGRLGSLEPVQERLRSTVSELGLHYRSSPIVCERGGTSQLRAGDRAPDCEATDERGARLRIFDLLKEPFHTALMVRPPKNSDLERFSKIFTTYRDIMHGMVLIDGDSTFRAQYMQDDGALYVIRPDGYIGFHGSADDFEGLEAWAGDLFLAPAQR